MRYSYFRYSLLCCAVVMLAAACRPAIPTLAGLVDKSSPTPPIPSTPIPTPSPIRTPPALPGTYQSPRLNPLDIPHTYIQDVCVYLRDKWDSHKAAPGTVVMIIKLHSISQGKPESPDDINVSSFTRMMADLHTQQFQAINMQQLADFLESNTKISARAVVLLQDGRHYAQNFNEHFWPYWDQWRWPVVNAWDNQGSTSEGLWADQTEMEAAGWVDHQVYGVTIHSEAGHISDEALATRIQEPIGTFQQRFHKAPIGIVWPTEFDGRATRIARESGYRLGFTFNPRGPVMFSWIPLANTVDNFRPSFLPEGEVGDPLMTLPRYWPYQVHDAIDTVRLIGREAADYARRNEGTEMQYYDIACASKYGPLP